MWTAQNPISVRSYVKSVDVIFLNICELFLILIIFVSVASLQQWGNASTVKQGSRTRPNFAPEFDTSWTVRWKSFTRLPCSRSAPILTRLSISRMSFKTSMKLSSFWNSKSINTLLFFHSHSMLLWKSCKFLQNLAYSSNFLRIPTKSCKLLQLFEHSSKIL